MDEMIGKLLRAGLLVSLGDDQERADRLRTASQHLRDRFLGTDRADVASALLAAVDEETPPDVPILERARVAIVGQWETFENAFAQKDPASILRAVTLDAVAKATTADEQVAAAAWYTLRSTAGTVSTGRWAQPIAEYRDDLDAAVAQHIGAAWVPPAHSSSLTMPSVPESKMPKLDNRALTEFRSVVEQHGADHAVREELPDLLDQLAAAAQRAESTETERLKAVVKALGERLRQILASHELLLAAVERRETLLWWRLGGRSDLLGSRYRDAVDPATAAVAAAFDLHRRVPEVAPEAAEHLLVDVLDEAGLSEGSVTVDDMTAVCGQLQLTTQSGTSAPFLVVDVIAGGCDRDGLARPLHGPMTTPDAAATLFRDLQIRRLLASQPEK